VRELDATTSRFDRRASTYQDSALQQFLFGPAQKTALQLALELVPQARRILDVGCGTGQLLRRARPCYPTAALVGVDLAAQMVRRRSRSPPPSWESAISAPAPSTCRSPMMCSTSCSPPCPCGTGQTHRPGSPRSAACSFRVGCSSSPTFSPTSDPATRPGQGCTVSTPPCQPISAACWPPIALLSSVATALLGSGYPTSRSSRALRRVGRVSNLFA
jgi:hypothetical protein